MAPQVEHARKCQSPGCGGIELADRNLVAIIEDCAGVGGYRGLRDVAVPGGLPEGAPASCAPLSGLLGWTQAAAIRPKGMVTARLGVARHGKAR